MSGRFALSCDCLRCVETGPVAHRWTEGHDISSARGIARSESFPDEQRWTGDGESDYAPGHEQAELDGTNREFVRVEERAQVVRLALIERFSPLDFCHRRPWQSLTEQDKEWYRELARQELLADRKRVRRLG